MKFTVSRLTDLFFPRRCVLCDNTLMASENGVCGDCKNKIKYISGRVCPVCGRKLLKSGEICEDCVKTRHVFLGGRFPFSYELIGDSVFRFKYSNRPEYAAFYAESIVEYAREFIASVDADGIIPVPLHKKRLAKRGYNQAELLAAEISKLTKIPMYADLAERVVNTRPQKEFDKKQRQINVKKAFNVKENSVKLRTVLVVDDIFTTGSTIDSLAESLKGSGVERVYFLTITAAST